MLAAMGRGVAVALLCLACCKPPSDRGTPGDERREAQVIVAVDGRADASGQPGDPVDSIARGLALAEPGDSVFVTRGVYRLREPVEVRVSGTPEAWIWIEGERGAVVDARDLAVAPPEGSPPYAQDQGAFAIAGGRYVGVQGLTIAYSHNAGITVRDSAHVSLQGNLTSHTFSSGIAVWDSTHVEIASNEVIHANDRAVAPAWFEGEGWTPHEAITVSGVEHFEVRRNHVHHGLKEGIDVKGDSKHGVVEDNDVHDNAHQGIYVDAWGGALVDVVVRRNRVHHNRGAGIVVSAEGEGATVEDVFVHHNVVVENDGSGIFVSRFGRDGAKRRIAIRENDVRRNGWGPAHADVSPLHWITGGLYLFSTNVDGLEVMRNVLVDNRAFQIGCSRDLLVDDGLVTRRIVIDGNAQFPAPNEGTVTTGWPRDDPDTIVPCPGTHPDFGPPEAW